MHNEITENDNDKNVYEPPTFEEAGSFRDSTGFWVVVSGDPYNPGWV